MSSDWHQLKSFLSHYKNEDVALVTLIHVEGSSYRKSGARLLVNRKGAYAGSLSGGCLEAGLAKLACNVIQTGEIKEEVVNTEPHFGCPGILTFLIEKISAGTLLSQILNELEKRNSFRLTTTQEGTLLGDHEGFLEEVEPCPRLLISGWTSDQDPLFQMVSVLGWEAIRLVKDETIAESLQPVANEKIVVCRGEELSKQFSIDSKTAFVIMSHHMSSDLSYLKNALSLNFFYIGLLGSHRRREKLLTAIGDFGLMENMDWIDAFHAPVGIDIGATNASTIALAILAEVQARLSDTKGGFLREKPGRITSEVLV